MIELIGFLLPPLIDLVNKKVSDKRLNFIVSLLMCVCVGVGVNVGNLNIDSLGDVLGSVSMVFASAQVAYALYWKKSELRKKTTRKKLK